MLTITTNLEAIRMSKIIIGVDPDSKAHGIAIYHDGILIELACMTLMDVNRLLQDSIPKHKNSVWEAHIENVCANNAVFMKPGRMDKRREAEAKARGRTLGMCQQAQTELERVFDFWGVKIVHHKISKTWKKDKAQFEKVTGWGGRSNEDTRSGAYFGWLGCK